jgi:hypothetical protein
MEKEFVIVYTQAGYREMVYAPTLEKAKEAKEKLENIKLDRGKITVRGIFQRVE